MAHTIPRILAAFIVWVGLTAQTVEPVIGDPDLPIAVNAESSDFDAKTNKLVFHDVDITQGENSIRAKLAEGTELEFQNSRWEFFGDVDIRLEDGTISADEATLTFVDHRLKTAVIRGKPARFRQQLECREEETEGHAGEMSYDFEAGVVQLTDQAWLKEGQREISGATLVYSLRDERVLATSDDTGPVEIVIQPGGDRPRNACEEPES